MTLIRRISPASTLRSAMCRVCVLPCWQPAELSTSFAVLADAAIVEATLIYFMFRVGLTSER